MNVLAVRTVTSKQHVVVPAVAEVPEVAEVECGDNSVYNSVTKECVDANIVEVRKFLVKFIDCKRRPIASLQKEVVQTQIPDSWKNFSGIISIPSVPRIRHSRLPD